MEYTDGTTKFVITKSGGVLPGTIVAFSGTFKDGYPVNKNTGLIDKEWHLCDGTNGTPNLVNRFIYGGNGTNNGTTGGEEKHTLTVSEMPHHRHGQNASIGNNTGYVAELAGFQSYNEEHPTHQGQGVWINSAGKTSNEFSQIMTDYSGDNQPHNNMPPYYVLAYIMKL